MKETNLEEIVAIWNQNRKLITQFFNSNWRSQSANCSDEDLEALENLYQKWITCNFLLNNCTISNKKIELIDEKDIFVQISFLTQNGIFILEKLANLAPLKTDDFKNTIFATWIQNVEIINLPKLKTDKQLDINYWKIFLEEYFNVMDVYNNQFQTKIRTEFLNKNVLNCNLENRDFILEIAFNLNKTSPISLKQWAFLFQQLNLYFSNNWSFAKIFRFLINDYNKITTGFRILQNLINSNEIFS